MIFCVFIIPIKVITSLSLSLSLSLCHFRLATGSFDQRTKIWTADGKPLLSISCNTSVTGLAYLPQMKVLWVAAGTQLVNFYEPKLGANVRLMCVVGVGVGVCNCLATKVFIGKLFSINIDDHGYSLIMKGGHGQID